jgi:ribonuclease E
VIDFIDMEDSKNDRNVESGFTMRSGDDRAACQIGKISQFGLMECPASALRAGVLAVRPVTCPHCDGQGIIRSTESAALRLLRARRRGASVSLRQCPVRAPS